MNEEELAKEIARLKRLAPSMEQFIDEIARFNLGLCTNKARADLIRFLLKRVVVVEP